MAVTSKSVQSADQPPVVEQPPTEQAPAAPTSESKDWDGYHCVVPDSDPTPHMGRATPGAKICSAHAMRYLPDGTPRGAR
jgi:hypothetical protein